MAVLPPTAGRSGTGAEVPPDHGFLVVWQMASSQQRFVPQSQNFTKPKALHQSYVLSASPEPD